LLWRHKPAAHCMSARADQVIELLVFLAPRDLLTGGVIVHAVVDLVIGPNDFIGSRIDLLANLRANPRLQFRTQALKRLALIAGAVAPIGCSDSDAARNVREAQAVLVLVAMLAACPAARLPIELEVFARVAELGNLLSTHATSLPQITLRGIAVSFPAESRFHPTVLPQNLQLTMKSLAL